jgi:hypothetical protein
MNQAKLPGSLVVWAYMGLLVLTLVCAAVAAYQSNWVARRLRTIEAAAAWSEVDRADLRGGQEANAADIRYLKAADAARRKARP